MTVDGESPPATSTQVPPGVRCISCGYDLAGLDSSGPCPECGTAIAASVRGDGLAFADAAYLKTLGRGLRVVRVSVTAALLSWLGGSIGLLLISAAGVRIPSWGYDTAIGGLLLASCCLYVLGWWVATTSDPRDDSQGLSRSAIIARYGTIAIIAAVACMLVLGTWLANVRDVVRVVLLFGLIVQHAAGSLYLNQLAERVPSARATKMSRNAFTAVFTLATAWTIEAVLDALNISPPRGSSGTATVLRLAMSLLGLVMFVAGIVAIARQFTAAGIIRKDVLRFLASRAGANS